MASLSPSGTCTYLKNQMDYLILRGVLDARERRSFNGIFGLLDDLEFRNSLDLGLNGGKGITFTMLSPFMRMKFFVVLEDGETVDSVGAEIVEGRVALVIYCLLK